jgi:DNA-directed RNA polymerase specialized sigma24 family protein
MGCRMPSAPESSNRSLESFREYLRLLLARMNMDPRLQARIDPSDLVQQTLLKAHEKQDQFRGGTDAERAAWLRTILANQMADALRKFHRQQGARERSIEEALDASSARLDAVGMSVTRTPLTLRSITSAARPAASVAWNRRAGSSRVARTSSSDVARSWSSTPAESTRQSIPRPASNSSISLVASAAPLEGSR